MNELRVTYPSNLELISLSHQRDGWHAHLRCDDSWHDDTGQSLFAMGGTGKAEEGPQAAIAAAVKRIEELVREINEEIPLRKENRMKKEAGAEEILALLGL